MHAVELCGDVPIDRAIEQTVEDYGGVDWDQLDILETVDEDGEGVQDIIDEDRLFRLLGLRTNEEQNERRKEGEAEPEFEGAGDRDNLGGNRDADNAIDTSGAAIPVDDHVPGEGLYVYDPNKPCMDIGTVYPNMKEFRLAMKQFAINEEFEVHIVKTDKMRYIEKCNAGGCPWHINRRTLHDGATVKVFNYLLIVYV